MATTDNLTDFLTGVADAIRAKKSTTALINPQNFASEIASISGGGGGEEPQPEGTHKVTFMDVDGTILKTEYVEEGGSATAPANPTRTWCTFVKWVGSYSNVTKDTVVLPQYASSDGRSHYEIDAKAGEFFALSVYHNNDEELTIDWGDGTLETVEKSGSSRSLEHTYIADVKGWVHISDSAKDEISLPQYTTKGFIRGYVDGGNCATLRERCRNCINLKYIVIPEGVTKIIGNAVTQCTDLTCLVIPEGVYEIGASAFASCYSLTSLVIPEGVTSIGASAFASCYSLTSLVIPEGVTSIGAQAFQNCYSLTSLTIPSSVTTILTSAFQMGNHMETIKSLPATPPTITNTTFGNMSKLQYIYVPDDSVETYKAATNWVAYADKILPLSEFTE